MMVQLHPKIPAIVLTSYIHIFSKTGEYHCETAYFFVKEFEKKPSDDLLSFSPHDTLIFPLYMIQVL